MNTHKRIAVALIAATLATSVFAAAGGPGGNGNGYGNTQGGNGAVTNALYPQACAPTLGTVASLTEAALASLRFMREEEKLARDVYAFLGNRWGSRVFANIGVAEQTHMDQVLSFMQAQGLTDSASTQAGVFNDASLQQLYDQLTQQGGTSLLEAMRVGALIEEVDIRDLRLAVTTTADAALNQIYLNLTSASYSHLRAFAAQIEMLQGTPYVAQVLTAADVSAILSGVGVAGLSGASVGLNGGNIAIVTATCFTPIVQGTTQSYGNGATITAGEPLRLATQLRLDTAASGTVADLVAIVEYTPTDSVTPFLLMRSGDNWVSWDGNRYTLTSAAQVTLTQQLVFEIFNGVMSGFPGQFSISTGYRLADGTLIFARDPIRFTIR